MKVIQFPKKDLHWLDCESTNDHLMDIAQHTLDRIADELNETAKNEGEFREQLIFILEQLSGIAEDLKEASSVI